MSSRYLTSIFLQHAKATDLYEAQKSALSGTDLMGKIVQISMDGPKVNWKMLRQLKADRAAAFLQSLGGSARYEKFRCQVLRVRRAVYA